MKIAIISSGDINNRKGFFNNVHERILRINKNVVRDEQVDVFLLMHKRTFFFNLLQKTNDSPIRSYYEIEGIRYNIIALKFFLWDYIATQHLKLRSIFCMNGLQDQVSLFSQYDLTLSHGPDANSLAYLVKERFGIPYVASWHGSEINFSAFTNMRTNKLIKKIIENARKNFFVSKKLMEKSSEITKAGVKEVLYTGASEYFYKMDKQIVDDFKRGNGVAGDDKIVGFIGNLVAVKNVKILPEIFSKLNAFDPSIKFWIVGDGDLEKDVRKSSRSFEKNCKFFGKKDTHEIPLIMNCLDVLVLPSLNEGLPRVCVEALNCGVPVVGSDVGGIKEVIGEENVIALGSSFVTDFTRRVIQFLRKEASLPELKPEFSDNHLEKIFSILFNDIKNKY